MIVPVVTVKPAVDNSKFMQENHQCCHQMWILFCQTGWFTKKLGTQLFLNSEEAPILHIDGFMVCQASWMKY